MIKIENLNIEDVEIPIVFMTKMHKFKDVLLGDQLNEKSINYEFYMEDVEMLFWAVLNDLANGYKERDKLGRMTVYKLKINNVTIKLIERAFQAFKDNNMSVLYVFSNKYFAEILSKVERIERV